jgi:peptidoglycan/LPS O-acetylase OafA/YrhL
MIDVALEKHSKVQAGDARLQSATFRPDIEGLRAIAILLVVGYHAALPGLSGGYVGVDIFFVLSGYLITGLLVGDINKTGKVDFRRFYARRARRLLPALTLTLLVTIIASAAIYPPSDVMQGGLPATAVSTAAYASNLYFARSGADYFAPDPEQNPFLHTWSLSVEEQFYLLWPLFIIFALRVPYFQYPRKANGRRLLPWMATAVVLSFILSLYLTAVRHSWAYFTSPTRAWEFALGGLVVLLPQAEAFFWIPRNGLLDRWINSLRLVVGKSAGLLGWMGIGGICLAAVAFGKQTLFPGFAVLLPVLSTILVLQAGTSRVTNSLVRVLQVRPLQEIGRLSYSWYLWHWPVLVLGSALVPAPSLSVRAGLVAFSLGLSVLSYRLVENPIRNARKLAGSHRYSFAMAAVLAVLGIGASFLWRQTATRKAVEPAQLRFTLAHKDFAAALLNDTCTTDVFDVKLRTCTFGAETTSPPIVLFGDSHAAQWFPALEPISKKRGLRLVPIVKLGCPAVDAPLFDRSLDRFYTECEEWRKTAIHKIQQIQPVLTIVSSSERYELGDAAWRNGIKSVLENLSESSQRVLVLRDNPGASFNIPSCLAVRLWRPSFIPSTPCEFPAPQTSKVYEFQLAAEAQLKNVFTADMSYIICPNGVCTGLRNGLVMYRDSNHLTASFVQTLEDTLGADIDSVLEPPPTLPPGLTPVSKHKPTSHT